MKTLRYRGNCEKADRGGSSIWQCLRHVCSTCLVRRRVHSASSFVRWAHGAAAAGGAVGLFGAFRRFGCFYVVSESVVDHDASAVFADNDFLVHFYFELALWRDAVEASSAGVALYGDYA